MEGQVRSNGVHPGLAPGGATVVSKGRKSLVGWGKRVKPWKAWKGERDRGVLTATVAPSGLAEHCAFLPGSYDPSMTSPLSSLKLNSRSADAKRKGTNSFS